MALGGGERSKQPGGDVGRDALPVVRDRHEHPRIRRPGVHGELARRLDATQGVDRVGQEIDHDLLELDGVAFHRRQIGVETPGDRDLVDAEPVRHEIERAAHDVVQVDARHLAFGGAHEPQQAAQQLGGPPGLAQDLRHLVARLVREARIGEAVLGMRGDRHERVVHLMGHAGEQLARGREPALFFSAVPQHLSHGVEMLREPAQLVSGLYGHADGEVAVGHPRQSGLELTQGTPHATPHHRDDREHEHDAADEPYHRVTAHTARGGPQRALSLDQVGPGDAIAVDPALLSEVDESIDRGHPGRDVRAPTSPEPDDDLGEGVAETRQGLVDARELHPQRRRDRCIRRDVEGLVPDHEEAPRERQRIDGRRGRGSECMHDADDLMKRAVPPHQLSIQGGNGLARGTEGERGATHAEQEVEGQGAGVHGGAEDDDEQRHPQIERSPRSRWRQPARRHGASRRRSGTVGAKVTPRLAGPRGGRHICPSW